MKHVFVIHSNLTYLAALGVISKENISLNDVVILAFHHSMENINNPIKCYYIKNYGIKDIFKYPYRTLRYVSWVDKIINELCCNENYVAYIDSMFPLPKIVATNKHCLNYHFLEEGLSVYNGTIPKWLHSYCPYSDFRHKNIRHFINDIFLIIKGYTNSVIQLPIVYNGYFNTENVKFYGFREESFYGVTKNKIKIDLKDVANKFDFHTNYNFNNVSVWLGTLICGTRNINTYIEAIEKFCIPHLKKQNQKKIYIKFHPAQSQEYRELEYEIFKKNEFDVIIIPDNIFFEIEMIKAINLSIYAVDTSVMLYALLCNIKCFSIIKRLKDFQWVNTPVLWNNITFL